MRLRRTSPDQPGWTRRRSGRGFTYLDEHGDRLPPEARERVQDLVIPPAWTDVWITPYENGHLQAIGVDAAGRKQYLYHPQWRERRDAEKFDRMVEFGTALAQARGTVLEHLGLNGMPLERALAASVRLLDLGYFRSAMTCTPTPTAVSASRPWSVGTSGVPGKSWCSPSPASRGSTIASRSTMR